MPKIYCDDHLVKAERLRRPFLSETEDKIQMEVLRMVSLLRKANENFGSGSINKEDRDERKP